MTIKHFTIFAVASLSLSLHAAEEGWINLFNGRDLSGWVEHSGKAKYTIEDGVLIGTSVAGTGNSFLCTTQTFDNFELELEFKADPLLNSGVQIRSEFFPDARTLTIGTNQIKVAADRVHGYQVEIDMDVARGRLWSAGIYDEARRGWLFPADGEQGAQGKAFSAQGAKVTKPGEWNKLRIVANGPSIKTWLNGVARAEINDSLTPRGIIALQVHSVGSDASKVGLKVQFRNIRLKPLASVASTDEMRSVLAEMAANTLTEVETQNGWRLLWDGKTTSGWRSARSETFPTKGWIIENGVLTVLESSGAEGAGGGDIITRERFSNFELKVDFKITPGANSGIKYFVQPNLDPIGGTPGPGGSGSAIGCEFQVLDDERHPDAKLGRDGDRTLGSLYDLIPAPTSKKVNPIGEWNTAHIVVRGKHVEHWLNGVKMLEYERGSDEFRKLVAESKFKSIAGFGEWKDGHILLQEHGNRVSFRNIKIRVLPQTNS
jgi:hypothetical protein